MIQIIWYRCKHFFYKSGCHLPWKCFPILPIVSDAILTSITRYFVRYWHWLTHSYPTFTWSTIFSYLSHSKLVFTCHKENMRLIYGIHRCSSRQISNGVIPKTHTRRWWVIKGSSQIQATCGTTDIPHSYLVWHSVFGSDPKLIYIGSTETSLRCHNSSPEVH